MPRTTSTAAPPEADIHLRGTLADLPGTRCGVQGQSFLPPPLPTQTTLPLYALYCKLYSTFLDSLPPRKRNGPILLFLRILLLGLRLRGPLSYRNSVTFSPPASRLEGIYLQIILFSTSTMKSVLVWAGLAIMQGLLVASAPVGPSGPCPDAKVDAILRGDMDPSVCCSYGQCKGDVVVSVGK
ncbi:hypothetical protein J3F83DRAFT_407361 [Trichoderma novae-zelandiae]